MYFSSQASHIPDDSAECSTDAVVQVFLSARQRTAITTRQQVRVGISRTVTQCPRASFPRISYCAENVCVWFWSETNTGVARHSGAHGQGTVRGPQTNGFSWGPPGLSKPLALSTLSTRLQRTCRQTTQIADVCAKDGVFEPNMQGRI